MRLFEGMLLHPRVIRDVIRFRNDVARRAHRVERYAGVRSTWVAGANAAGRYAADRWALLSDYPTGLITDGAAQWIDRYDLRYVRRVPRMTR